MRRLGEISFWRLTGRKWRALSLRFLRVNTVASGRQEEWLSSAVTVGSKRCDRWMRFFDDLSFSNPPKRGRFDQSRQGIDGHLLEWFDHRLATKLRFSSTAVSTANPGPQRGRSDELVEYR